MKNYQKALLAFGLTTASITTLSLTLLNKTNDIKVEAQAPNVIADEKVVVANVKEFIDIPHTHPYYEMINKMAERGIISGYADGSFKPNENINRQHAAVLINNAVDLPTKIPFKAFNDVNSTHPYYQAIRSLQTAGLIEADSNGNFNPTKPLTRGEMAKIIATAYDLDNKGEYTFEDVVGTEYEDYVTALYTNGITSGYEDGTFRPNESLTRAHYALFMYRASNIDESMTSGPLEEEVKETIPTLPTSKELEDYPSDVIVTSHITEKFYEHLVIPNSNAQTIEEKLEDILNITNKQKEKMLELKEKNKVNSSSTTVLVDGIVNGETLEERIKSIANSIQKTVPETIQLINYAYDTGEVYDGGTFSLYFGYANNSVRYSYR